MMRKSMLVVFLFFLLSGVVRGQAGYSSPDTGHKVLGSYFATDIDDISLKNGNLHVSIPLFTLPGRELPLNVSMEYDSQLYENRVIYDPPSDPVEYYEFLGWRKKTGVGGLLNATKGLGTPYSNGNWYQDVALTFTWIEWDGTKHDFAKTLTRSCVYGGYGFCDTPSIPDSEVYDGHIIDSGASEFLRLSTGTHFSSASQPAKVFFKDGRYVNVTARTANTRNGNFLGGNSSTQTVTVVPAGMGGTGLADYLPTTDTTGRSIGWSDNGTTQTITITDVNGQPKIYRINWTTLTLTYAHPCVSMNNNGFKVVTSIELPNGKTYTFDYNTTGYLSKITLPSGAYVRYTYGVSGCRYVVISRVVSSDGTAGTEKTWSYSTGPTATVTHPAGNSQVHEFTSGLNTKVLYRDAAANVLKTVDRSWNTGTNPNVSTEKTTLWIYKRERKLFYDSYNNVTQEEDYDWGMGAVGPRLRYITKTYSVSNQSYLDNWILTRPLTEKVYTNAGTLIAETNFELDNYASPNQLITRSGTIPGWTDPGSTVRGNTTHIKRWFNTNGSWLTTVQRYDVLGNVATVTDPGGHATQIDFTDNFTDSINRYSYAYAKRGTDPTGFYADTTYDFNTGLVRQVTDALSRTTATTYDVMNRELQTTNPISGWTRYVYDDVTPKVTKEILVDAQGNLGRVITRVDKLYRVTQTETSDPAGNIFVDMQYDSNGRKWKVSNPYRTGDTVVWTQFQYDAMDRPTVTTAPDNSTVQYAYKDNQTTVTDEAGNQRRYTYDGLGQMTKVEEPNPTLDTPLVTTYAYNVLDKLTQTIQGAQTRTFNFDSLGRMSSQVLPESGTTTFVYNVDDQLKSKTDSRSITTTITYHATHVHKLGTRSYSDGTPSVSFQYDSAGRQTQMTDGLGTVTQTYFTNTDRLYQEQRALTGVTGTFTTAYAYNIKGDLTQMTYPSGRIVNFNYATGGGCCNSRLSSVVDQTTSTTVNGSIGFNAAGETTAHTLGNGLAQSYTYNSRLQLTGIAASLSGTTLMNFAYDYGTSTTNTGRLLSRTDNVQQEHSAKYTYDSIYRLGQAISNDAAWGAAWTFDTWGNRVTQTPQGLATSKVGTQTLGYTNNRLNGNTYDAAGNQTNDGSHNYTFNAENQITQMDGGAAVYAYDGEGRRMKKTFGSETTYFFYGVGGLLCEFTTANTGVTQAASTDRTTYRTSDKLGSAVLIMSASGTVIDNNRTLPYGETWLPEVSSTNDKKFTTYQRDQESGLDYAMNRFYGNSNGRFNSPDKAGPEAWMPITLNRYLYAVADPINHTDPDGNFIAKPRFPAPLPPIGPAIIFRNPHIFLIRERQEQDPNRAARELANRGKAILDKITSTPGCEAMLGGLTDTRTGNAITLDSVVDTIRRTQYLEGVGSKVTYGSTLLNPTAADQNRTVDQVIGPGTHALADFNRNRVFLNAGTLQNMPNDEMIAGLLIHEALHYMTGYGHGFLDNAMGVNQGRGGLEVSDAATNTCVIPGKQ